MKNLLPILERIISTGLLTKDQLKKVQEQYKISGVSLDKLLVKEGMISETDLANAIADELGIPCMDLQDYLIDVETIKFIPEKLAREKNLIPLFKIGNVLSVAMSDPQDIMAIDEIRFKSGLDVEPVLATESAIKNAIEQFYGVTGTMSDILKIIDKQKVLKASEEIGIVKLTEMAQEAPIVKFVNLLVMEAVKERASDIHIEPEQDRLRIRFRIDGVLHEISSPAKHIQSAIISRIKVLSKMDIAERRRPQDGRLQMHMENRDIDVRVSTFPTVYGENVVLRILDKAGVILELAQLGFSSDTLNEYEKLLKRPNGIILVTGPTGSGKTTTLYASIQTLNSEERNIITIEDPVEYYLPMIRQSQINPKAGVTFADGLRSILRQDPDVIMVGEIRDVETADIAVQAALTGHLVFSTLHTNDAAGAVTRLLDMGVEPFLVTSSVIGVLAQRLVRMICVKCKEKYISKDKIDINLRQDLSVISADAVKADEPAKEITLFKGKGCKVCKQTGFYGRVGIYELIAMNDKLRKLIVEKASSEDIKKLAQKSGMRTLREDGLLKVKNGVTTLEEAVRVTVEQ